MSTLNSNQQPQIKVPKSDIRCFYESLKVFSTETQKYMLKDLNRKNNYNKLVGLYKKSYNRIVIYNNPNEPMLDKSNSKRKQLPITIKRIKNTVEVVSVISTHKPSISVSNPKYDFEYIEREINPLRTTNGIYDTGLKASASGTGGLDFIGWNLNSNLPILGEIKVAGDQNPFYALIQLLTYLSEISTPNQINRINKHSLFGKNLISNERIKFYLYILSCREVNHKKKYDRFLDDTKILAKQISTSINQIEDIIFLRMDPVTKNITTE